MYIKTEIFKGPKPVFKTEAAFEKVVFESNCWRFYFSSSIAVEASEFWRIHKDGKIIGVSFDHGHQFGLPEPLDLVKKLTELLKAKTLLELNVDQATGDLTMHFSDDIKIEIFICSWGYETYHFSVENKRYIGLGGGTLGVHDIPPHWKRL